MKKSLSRTAVVLALGIASTMACTPPAEAAEWWVYGYPHFSPNLCLADGYSCTLIESRVYPDREGVSGYTTPAGFYEIMQRDTYLYSTPGINGTTQTGTTDVYHSLGLTDDPYNLPLRIDVQGQAGAAGSTGIPGSAPTFRLKSKDAVNGVRAEYHYENSELYEASPGFIAWDMAFPSDMLTPAFNFMVLNKGDGDWLDLQFDGSVLWSSYGLDLLENTIYEGSFDSSLVAGKTGLLSFVLHSAGEPNARYFIDIEDVTLPSGVPEPSTWAMMIAGFGLIGGSLRRRRNQALSGRSFV